MQHRDHRRYFFPFLFTRTINVNQSFFSRHHFAADYDADVLFITQLAHFVIFVSFVDN
jgi:hypothetical protein